MCSAPPPSPSPPSLVRMSDVISWDTQVFAPDPEGSCDSLQKLLDMQAVGKGSVI